MERIARGLEQRGLAAPALLWLESSRPLARLLGQGLRAWTPWLEALLPGGTVRRWRRVCEDPALYTDLLDRLAGDAAAPRREETP